MVFCRSQNWRSHSGQKKKENMHENFSLHFLSQHFEKQTDSISNNSESLATNKLA